MENDNKLSVTASQGAQPSLGTLRIGIIEVARFNNVSKARLLLRPASGDKAVIITEGDSLEVEGHGVLTLEHVDVQGNGAVTLSLSPAGAEQLPPADR